MLAVIVHHIVGGDECGHISTGLPRQIGIDFPVVGLSVGTVNGLVDVFGSAVVGGDDQVPVAEYLVQVFQVACGSI